MGADALSNRITALQAKLNIEQTDEGRIALVDLCCSASYFGVDGAITAVIQSFCN
jgi:hypothetical protein